MTPDTVLVLYKYKYFTSIVPLRYSLTVHVAKLVITAAHHRHFSESHILKVRNWTKKLIYLDINSTADYNWFGLRFLLLWPLLLNLKICFLGNKSSTVVLSPSELPNSGNSSQAQNIMKLGAMTCTRIYIVKFQIHQI